MDPIDQEQEVQGLLVKPYRTFKTAIQGFVTKLWQAVHYPIRQLNWLSFVAIISIVASAVFVGTMWKYRSPRESITSEKFSVFGQLKELSNRRDYFYKVATPLEKYIKWKTMFYGWKYKLNGDPKVREADCVGAVYTYYRSWGSNFRLESVPWLIKRISNLKEKQPGMVRKSLSEVRSGDLIVLKYSEQNQHVGVVVDTPNGFCRYVSMNVGTMTEGDDLVSFNDPAVVFVSEINFELWAGETLEGLNK